MKLSTGADVLASLARSDVNTPGFDGFGVHNMSITADRHGQLLITSLYDWETGCIVPALLSWLEMAVTVDLVTDLDGAASIARTPGEATSDDLPEFMTWSTHYREVCPDRLEWTSKRC